MGGKTATWVLTAALAAASLLSTNAGTAPSLVFKNMHETTLLTCAHGADHLSRNL